MVRFDKHRLMRQLEFTLRLARVVTNLVVGSIAVPAALTLSLGADPDASIIAWMAFANSCLGFLLTVIEPPPIGWRKLLHVLHVLASLALCPTLHVWAKHHPRGFFGVVRLEIILIGFTVGCHLADLYMLPLPETLGAVEEESPLEGPFASNALVASGSSSPPSIFSMLRSNGISVNQNGFHGDTKCYKVAAVSWEREADVWGHEFVVIRATRPDTAHQDNIWLRTERYQTSWSDVLQGRLTQDSVTVGELQALTGQSARIAMFDLGQKPGNDVERDLLKIVELLFAAHEQKMRLVFPRLRCWWFAACCFERLATHLVPNEDQASCFRRENLSYSIGARTPLDDLVRLCRCQVIQAGWTLRLGTRRPPAWLFIGAAMVYALLFCGWWREVAPTIMVVLVIWIVLAWQQSICMVLYMARLNERYEGQKFSRVGLRTAAALAMMATAAILGVVSALGMGSLPGRPVLKLICRVYLVGVLPTAILALQLGFAIYLTGRMLWRTLRIDDSPNFCGTEHPHEYLRHGGDNIPGAPHTFKLVGVSWWQQHDALRHQFLIIGAKSTTDPEAEPVFVRIERDKTGWLAWRRGNINDTVRIASTLEALTRRADRIVRLHTQPQDDCDLPMLSRLVQVINEESPVYFLPTLNCYWFAFTCFERLGSRMGGDVALLYAQGDDALDTDESFGRSDRAPVGPAVGRGHRDVHRLGTPPPF
ncbi:hypothetical protein FRB96_007279 [Tulasnella sp. 330]|nr:hypothetical protein FRB96_007279 [Tulasnella sp. 330]